MKTTNIVASLAVAAAAFSPAAFASELYGRLETLQPSTTFSSPVAFERASRASGELYGFSTPDAVNRGATPALAFDRNTQVTGELYGFEARSFGPIDAAE